jgi:hypothetical protein
MLVVIRCCAALFMYWAGSYGDNCSIHARILLDQTATSDNHGQVKLESSVFSQPNTVLKVSGVAYKNNDQTRQGR